MPLVNDSLFFLGSCYLGRVDEVVARHSDNFIRFVDDYRIFGSSMEELERAQESISAGLVATGFALNPTKVKLGSRAEFFDAVQSIEKHQSEDEYYGVRTFLDVLSPEQLVRLVDAALKQPERYLTVRFGRLVSAELRRVRDKRDGGHAHREFMEQLGTDEALNERAWSLLETLSKVPGEDWRLTWLLYLAEDLSIPEAVMERLERLARGGSRLVRVWARRVAGGCERSVHLRTLDLSYIDEAAASCKGVG